LAILAILQPDARVAARLGTALDGTHETIVCPSWHALRESLGEGGIDGCIVDAGHPSRDSARNELSDLRAEHPTLAIVAYVDTSADQDYYDLGGIGVDGLIVSGQRDGASRVAVSRALVASSAAGVAADLLGTFGSEGVRAVAWTIEHAPDNPDVDTFASGLGLTTGGLTRLLRSEKLPPPSRLLLWGRLMLAGALLGRDGQTVEEAAFSLGYSTAAALARAMKKHTGLTPGEVGSTGGMSSVQNALFRNTAKGRRGTTLKSLAVLGLLATQSACAGIGGGVRGVDRTALETAIDTSPVDQVHFGVMAVDARTGRLLYSRNAHRKFVPASNQKILVTATALSLLGADFRYETEVWATGSVMESMLDGDLVVLASGDPTMSRRFWDSGEAALAAIADSLHRRGLRQVTGSVFVDVSRWDSTSVGPTWEVEDLRFAYGSTGGAFAVDEGEIQVVVSAGPAVGSPASVQWAPRGTADYLTSRILTVPPDSSSRIRPSYLPESRRLVLDGWAEMGTVDTTSFAIRDPVRQATAALGLALRQRGITIEGTAQVAWSDSMRVGRGCLSGLVPECPNAGRIFTMTSPPLADISAQILERSQNWMTEQLIRTLGDERGEQGSWSEGVDVIRDFLTEEVGVDSLDVAPRDGSGLSAYNLVTPRALIGILSYMKNGPNWDTFRDALASPGEEDSTLERRLVDLEGRLFAKTGTISNVNSLSGYLVREDGSEVIFSVLSNGSGLPSPVVRAAIDDVVRELAR
jgi:serine-type D-Ala-D-Ala carboxypeptidase/endopeptidase (penicillin-binding protein 4)